MIAGCGRSVNGANLRRVVMKAKKIRATKYKQLMQAVRMPTEMGGWRRRISWWDVRKILAVGYESDLQYLKAKGYSDFPSYRIIAYKDPGDA